MHETNKKHLFCPIPLTGVSRLVDSTASLESFARTAWPRLRQRGGVLDLMHARSRTIIDPRIPTMSGRSTPGFPSPRRHLLCCTKREAKCEVFGELHEG